MSKIFYVHLERFLWAQTFKTLLQCSVPDCLLLARQTPPVGQGLLIREVSRPY